MTKKNTQKHPPRNSHRYRHRHKILLHKQRPVHNNMNSSTTRKKRKRMYPGALQRFTIHRHDHIYIYFIHVPKTAGSAIKDMLRRNDKRPPHPHKPREGWLLHTKTGIPVHIIARGHSEASSFPPRARNVFKLATIRQPVERFVSAYNFVREGGKNHPNQGAVQQARNWAPFLQKYKTIDAFLRDTKAVKAIMNPKNGHTHFDLLTRWLNTQPGIPDIDVYIRQTDVQTDLRAFCEIFDLDVVDSTIHAFNVTGEKSKRTAFTDRTLTKLLDTDVQLHNSILDTFQSIHRQCKQKVQKMYSNKNTRRKVM